MFVHTRGEDTLPVRGVGENVLHVLAVVHFGLFMELEVHRRKGGGVGIRCISGSIGHYTVGALTIIAHDGRSGCRRILSVVSPPVGGTNGTCGDVPPALEQRCVDSERVDGLGHAQSRLAVGLHGIVVGLDGRDEIFQILAELGVTLAKDLEVLGAIFGFGNASFVFDAGYYASLCHFGLLMVLLEMKLEMNMTAG